MKRIDDFMTKHVPPDRQAEFMYRAQERLGILCGDGEPTSEQVEIALGEAREWLITELKNG